MRWEAAVALVVPLIVAIFFRVPRRTLLLEKEVQILEKLPMDSNSRSKLESHISDLVDQEIDLNRSWKAYTAFASGVLSASYGAFLILMGFSAGGFWWIGAVVGAAIEISLAVVLVIIAKHAVERAWIRVLRWRARRRIRHRRAA